MSNAKLVETLLSQIGRARTNDDVDRVIATAEQRLDYVMMTANERSQFWTDVARASENIHKAMGAGELGDLYDYVRQQAIDRSTDTPPSQNAAAT